MSKVKLKRGDVVKAEIKSSDNSGAKIYIKELEQEFFLHASEINVGDFKKIRNKKIDKIAVRVKTARPLSFSAKRVDASKLNVGKSEESKEPVQQPEKKPEVKVSVSSARSGGMVWCMVWWSKLDAAVRYTVRLYIQTTKSNEYKHGKQMPTVITKQEIAKIEKDRHTAYHTFTDLTQLPYESGSNNYYNRYDRKPDINRVYAVTVEAEDREGNIIAKSEFTPAEVN